jgi:serine/threonine protein kinase
MTTVRNFLVDFTKFEELEILLDTYPHANVRAATDLTTGLQVAIEHIRPSESKVGSDEFSKTAKALFYFFRDLLGLIGCAHPAVLGLRGWNISLRPDPGNELFLVTQLLASGPLLVSDAFTTPTLFATDKTVFAYGAARALAFLHGLGVVHRNVKPQNFYLDARLRPHLGSFECATTAAAASREVCGTFRYMAPEIMTGQPSAPPIDVYAFGIMLFEVTEEQRHEFPPGVRAPPQIRAEVVKGYRPKPTKAPPTLAALMGRCWAPTPAARPSFAEIVGILEQPGYWLPDTDPAVFAEYKAFLDEEEAKLAPDRDAIAKIGRLPELYELYKKTNPATPFKELVLTALGWLTSTGAGLNEGLIGFLRFELDDDVQLSAPTE